MKRSIAAAAAAAFLGVGGVASAGAATLGLNLTADNQFAVYLSTSDSVLGTEIGAGNAWGTTYAFSQALTAGTHFIHVIAANWTPENGIWGSAATPNGTGDNPDGLIGTFNIVGGKFANGATTLSTNTTDWKASEAGAYPYDTIPVWTGATGTPQSYGLNGVGPWGDRPSIASNAEWIWSNPDNGQYAEFSTSLTAVPEASTWAMLVSGFAALGFTAFHRSRKAQPMSIVG